MATYTLTTTALEEEALTAAVAQQNAHAPSLSMPPWADNAAYVTAQAKRAIFDPATAAYVEDAALRLAAQARHATLPELKAADAALPDLP